MWFTENPWPPMFLCAVGAVVCLIVWYQRQQPRFLAGAGALVLLAAGIWVIERAIVTERERVRENVFAVTSSFQRRDLDGTLDYISQQAPDLRRLVVYGYNVAQVEDDMRVTDVQVEMTAQETRATTRFRVNATVTGHPEGGMNFSHRQPTRWEAKWQQEAGEWRMFDIQQLDPITGERINQFSGIRNWLSRHPSYR
jgi:hypothetical protein